MSMPMSATKMPLYQSSPISTPSREMRGWGALTRAPSSEVDAPAIFKGNEDGQTPASGPREGQQAGLQEAVGAGPEPPREPLRQADVLIFYINEENRV